MKPQSSSRLSPAGQLKVSRTLTQKVPWCHGQAQLVETRAKKGALTPNFTRLLPPRQINSHLSLLSNSSSYEKPPGRYATHLTQHRLNYQLPGTSPVLNTYRVIGKEIYLCLLHPATSYCFKKTLCGRNQYDSA